MRSPPATRRTPAPSPRSSAGRTRSCRSSASARRASTSSARTAARRGGRSPRGEGSGRRRSRPAAVRPRGRSGRSLRCLLLLGEPVLLHLEVDVVRAERLQQVVGVAASQVGAAGEQVLAEARLEASGERDQTVRVGGDLREVDRWLAPLEARRGSPPKRALRGSGSRPAVAARASCGSGRASRGPPRVIVDDVHLAPEDRLDIVLRHAVESSTIPFITP